MNCPHCGADISRSITICPLCEKEIDRDTIYNGLLKKGDEALSAGEVSKAIANYNKALEFIEKSYEPKKDPALYVKLGNAYGAKNDKRAASMYLKALEIDFYNEGIHNLLINIYDKFGRLNNLKQWYERGRGKFDENFVNKMIKIIEQILYFKGNEDFKIKAPRDNFIKNIFRSFLNYSIFNAVSFILVILFAAGVVGVMVYHLNMSFVFGFAGMFFVVSLSIVIFYRIKHVNKLKKEKKTDLTEIFKDFKINNTEKEI